MQSFFLSSNVGFLEYEGYYQVVHEGSTTAKPIDASKLPFDEWERVCEKVKKSAVPGVDIEHFDFTFLSFLTYFLIVRNRKREYLTNENKSKSMDSVWKITDVFQHIVCEYFLDANKNKYCNLFKYRDIAFSQKMGVKVFLFFARRKKLKTLVKIAYKLL